MATPRTSQAHEKRVQKIAEEAASKIAQDAPLEEEVIVVVEELPPAETSRTQRVRSTKAEPEPGSTMLSMIAVSQQLVADGINRWAALLSPFGTETGSMGALGNLVDARHMTQEGFRFAEELLASQKQFALRVVAALTPAQAA